MIMVVEHPRWPKGTGGGWVRMVTLLRIACDMVEGLALLPHGVETPKNGPTPILLSQRAEIKLEFSLN
jgi:hypothetical protein